MPKEVTNVKVLELFSDLVTIPEAQRLLGGESRSGIYRSLRLGQLEAVKRGRRTLILVVSIQRRIQELPAAVFAVGRAS